MEHTPVIYVIIPVYKAEKYISQTLDSVLGQPYPNIEIVCVDDGSPDDSISILREYEKRYHNIHVIRQKNAGVSAARNTGIEHVLQRGMDGYVTFLDADDLWAKNVLENPIKDMDGHPDCVGYKYVRCSEDLTRMAPPPALAEKLIPGGSKSLWAHFDYPFGAVLYSCRMLQKYSIRFIEKLHYAEDSIFKFTCFYLADSIKLVDKVMYCYRINTSSAMHHRKYGIEYMPPIIRGYLYTASFLSKYENIQRGSTQFCRIMAGLHTIEMVEEHFQKFRSTRKLKVFLRENTDVFEVLQQLNRNDLSDKHRQLYDLFFHSPGKFRIRCYLAGVRTTIKDILKKCKPVVIITNKKKFTLSNKYL